MSAIGRNGHSAQKTLVATRLTAVIRRIEIPQRNSLLPYRGVLFSFSGQPGGNVTGFMIFEYSLSGKWLELLKEIAPLLIRAAVFRDSANPAGVAQFGAIQAVAQSLGVVLQPVDTSAAGEHAI
jgi:putative ABC transport system substrate-binding protein